MDAKAPFWRLTQPLRSPLSAPRWHLHGRLRLGLCQALRLAQAHLRQPQMRHAPTLLLRGVPASKEVLPSTQHLAVFEADGSPMKPTRMVLPSVLRLFLTFFVWGYEIKASIKLEGDKERHLGRTLVPPKGNPRTPQC